MESVLLLLSYGADVNAMTDTRHDYRTVLHYAVLSGNLTTVNLLLKQGASVNYPPGINKPTPLDMAILRGDPELVEMLIAAGSFMPSLSYSFRVRAEKHIFRVDLFNPITLYCYGLYYTVTCITTRCWYTGLNDVFIFLALPSMFMAYCLGDQFFCSASYFMRVVQEVKKN